MAIMTGAELQMCKKLLRERQMGDAAYVDQAADWARALTQRESRGPGDLENAWRRLEARYGVPSSMFWALRYRRPKDIMASVFFRLHGAYQAECARQMRKLQHDIELTKAIAGPDHPVVVAAQAVVDADDE